jgi:hypothetical protein
VTAQKKRLQARKSAMSIAGTLCRRDAPLFVQVIGGIDEFFAAVDGM